MKYPTFVIYALCPELANYSKDTVTLSEAAIQVAQELGLDVQPDYYQMAEFIYNEEKVMVDWRGIALPIVECDFPNAFLQLQKEYQEKTGNTLPNVSEKLDDGKHSRYTKILYCHNGQPHEISKKQYYELLEMKDEVHKEEQKPVDEEKGILRTSSLIYERGKLNLSILGNLELKR